MHDFSTICNAKCERCARPVVRATLPPWDADHEDEEGEEDERSGRSPSDSMHAQRPCPQRQFPSLALLHPLSVPLVLLHPRGPAQPDRVHRLDELLPRPAACYTADNGFFRGKTETFSLTRFFLEVTQAHPPARSAVFSPLRTCVPPEPRASGRIWRMWPGLPLPDGKPNGRGLPRRRAPLSTNPPLRSPTAKPVRHGPGSSPRCMRSTPDLHPMRLLDAVEFALQTPRQFPLRGNCTFFAVITEPQEIRKDPGNLRLLQPPVAGHLVKIGRSPPGLDPSFG